MSVFALIFGVCVCVCVCIYIYIYLLYVPGESNGIGIFLAIEFVFYKLKYDNPYFYAFVFTILFREVLCTSTLRNKLTNSFL